MGVDPIEREQGQDDTIAWNWILGDILSYGY